MLSEAISYAESVGAVFVETSAKTGVNVNVLFHEISEYLSNSLICVVTKFKVGSLHVGLRKGSNCLTLKNEKKYLKF